MRGTAGILILVIIDQVPFDTTPVKVAIEDAAGVIGIGKLVSFKFEVVVIIVLVLSETEIPLGQPQLIALEFS